MVKTPEYLHPALRDLEEVFEEQIERIYERINSDGKNPLGFVRPSTHPDRYTFTVRK